MSYLSGNKIKQNKNFLNKIGKKIGFNLSYYFKNSFWIMVRQIVTIITGLTLTIFFARFISKDTFGQYEFILSIFSLISILGMPGIKTAIIGSVARGCDGDYKKSIKTSFLWGLLGTPLLSSIGIYYYINNNQTLGIVLIFSSVLSPLLYSTDIWDYFLQGKEKFSTSTKYAIISALFNTISIATVIWFYRDNLFLIVFVYLASLIAFNILWSWRSSRYIENQKQEEGTIKYGYFLTKTSILSLIAGNLDSILIAILLSPAQLATYIIGVNFARKIQASFKGMLAVTSPKISRINTVSGKNYLKVFVTSAVLAMMLYLSFPILIPILFSSKYTSSVFLSQIVIVFLPFYVLDILYKNHFLFYLKNKKILFLESFIQPTIKILLMIPLLFFFNIKGLALLMGFQPILNIAILYILGKKFSLNRS